MQIALTVIAIVGWAGFLIMVAMYDFLATKYKIVLKTFTQQLADAIANEAAKEYQAFLTSVFGGEEK